MSEKGLKVQNKDVIRRSYDLFSEGKVAQAAAYFAPDAIWRFPGQSALSGEYRGREAILNEFLAKFPRLSGSTFRTTLVDVADGDEHSFVLQRSQAERDGRSIDYLVCHVYTIQDDLIRSVETYPYDARAQEEFWQEG